MSTRDLTFEVSTFMMKVLGSKDGLRVQWFDEWNERLDEALALIPEAIECPHELFRRLAENKTPFKKKFAVVTHGGRPVAIPALRQKGHRWEPITKWLLPGFIFPAQDGFLIPAMAALGIEVEVAWWRMEGPPPDHPWLRDLEDTQTYSLPLTGDYEEYWRETGLLKKSVRPARKRCSGFTLTVDSPDAVEWVTKSWAEKWADETNTLLQEVSDRIVAAKYLEAQGRHHSFLLLDNGKPIAGATVFVHDNDLVASCIYRCPEYDHNNVGTRIIDLIVEWGAERGFRGMNFGGGYGYKGRWAPPEGKRWKFQVYPPYLMYAKHVLKIGRSSTRT